MRGAPTAVTIEAGDLDRVGTLVPQADRARMEHYTGYVLRTGLAVHFEVYDWNSFPPMQSLAHILPNDDGSLAVFIEAGRTPEQWTYRTDRFTGLFDQINDVIVIAEPNTDEPETPHIIHVNAAFERMTGYTRDEVLGETPQILQGSDTEPAAKAAIHQALRKWEPIQVELKNYRKSGEAFFVELDYSPVQDETGWYCYWVAVQREITQRRQLELLSAAQSRLNAAATLAGGLTHDIGNDLMSIASYLSLTKDETSAFDPAYHKEVLSTVLKVQDKVQLFSDYLTPKDRSEENLDLQTLLKAIGELSIRGTAGQVRVFGPATQMRFVGRREHWSTMFLNVLVNAREACVSETSGSFTIDVHVLLADDQILIRVTDSGPGILAELCEGVFEANYSTKTEGGGFGLPASRAIAEVYGGSLRYIPRNGKGARFEFRFPRARFTVQSGSRESQT